MNSEKVARALVSGGTVSVTADGQLFNILPDEVEVKAQAKEGFAVAEEGAYVAALVTELTSELVQEGLAREFVRRVQDFRKSAGLDVADRVNLFVVASPNLKSAIEAHREYITNETLSTSLDFNEPACRARRLLKMISMERRLRLDCSKPDDKLWMRFQIIFRRVQILQDGRRVDFNIADFAAMPI